jgi:hypothetical protein
MVHHDRSVFYLFYSPYLFKFAKYVCQYIEKKSYIKKSNFNILKIGYKKLSSGLN